MKRERLILLVGSCLVGVLTVATAHSTVPQVVRIALGTLLVLILPGFTLVCAVIPEREFSRGERLLASVGMSLGDFDMCRRATRGDANGTVSAIDRSCARR